MPRITAPDAPCEMRFRDQMTNERYTLFYRPPTAEERIQYRQQMVAKKRNKVVSNFPETALKFGMKILTGFKKGNFAKLVDGKPILYASEPADPDYDPDWKELIRQYASDLVTSLAANLFDGTLRDAEEEEEPEDEEEPDGKVADKGGTAEGSEEDGGPKD